MALLSRRLEELSQRTELLNSEATLRHEFLTALDEYVSEAKLFPIDPGPLFRLEDRIITSRSDARIGGIALEVKLPLPRGAGISAAEAQATRYVLEYRERGQNVRAIGYDGHSIVLLDEEARVVFKGVAHEASPVLASWLSLLAPAATTPEEMVGRFGVQSALGQHSLQTLSSILEKFAPRIPFIAEVFEIWKEIYGCAANINDETIQALRRHAGPLGLNLRRKSDAERFVFVTETYLSILLKLFVARVTVEEHLVPYQTVAEIIGEPVGRQHLRYRDLTSLVPHLKNVFEEDPFQWFIDAASDDRDAQAAIDQILSCVAETVDHVNLVEMGQDFLRSFYQQFFDRASRLALGEFYTNDELVRETLDAAGYDGNPESAIIDYCCGSGSFIVEILNRIKRSARLRRQADLLQLIQANVVAVDIHPLAVAMARVNFLIAITPLLERNSTFSIPVYWADSLVRLSKKRARRFEGMGEVVNVQIPGMHELVLPDPEEFSWQDLFDFARERIATQRGPIDFEGLWTRFEQDFPSELVLRFEDSLQNFLKQIVERHNSGKNTRWLPILRNVLLLESRRRSFDFVVGNPPWVRTHNIAPVLRARVNRDYSYCENAGWRYGCSIAGIGVGFAKQTDLCVPFVERSFELLKDGGTLSFVLTSKIQQALYANELRRHITTEKTLKSIHDYSLYGKPLFQDAVNYPTILTVVNEPPNADTNCEIRITNQEGRQWQFSVPQESLPLIAVDKESPWLLAPPEVIAIFRDLQTNGELIGSREETRVRRGVVTGANEVFIVNRLGPCENQQEAVIETDSGIGRVERERLRPLVRGRDISAWTYDVTTAILWTHDDNTAEPLTELPEKTREFLTTEERSVRLARRDDYRASLPLWAIFRCTTEKLGPKVGWKKYGTRTAATVLPKTHRLPLTGGDLLIPLQTTYFIPTTSDKDAHLLAAILNSTVINAYTASFSMRARGGYFHYIGWVIGLCPIPVSSSSLVGVMSTFRGRPAYETLLAELVELSERLHRDPTQADATRERLDALVSGAFNLSPEQLNVIRHYAEFMQSGRAEAKLDEEEEQPA